MKSFLSFFQQQLDKQPNACAISNSLQKISYFSLNQEINKICAELSIQGTKKLAISMPNCPAYIAVDIAATAKQITSIPIPHFFSSDQLKHLFFDASVDTVILDSLFDIKDYFLDNEIALIQEISIFNQSFSLVKLKTSPTEDFSPDCWKISYTSGTTGQPKGVKIVSSEADKIICSLLDTLNASPQDRHISVLPFSLLLENTAGVYTALAAGGCCLVPDFSELGVTGSSTINIKKFLKALRQYQPSTMITVPALAQILVSAGEQGMKCPSSLRFIAIGGAPVSASILKRAKTLELPLFQGYGLTECSSVVSLNIPGQNRIGSVGKPLKHIEIDFSKDNEILVSGAVCDGYVKQQSQGKPLQWATGDLGYLDKDGYLYITGRKRTTYCTAYGRNISPEWIESELVSHPDIRQAMIYGEAKPFNLAIIVPGEGIEDAQINLAINDINLRLPDYAQIRSWFRANQPYSPNNRQLSATGIIRRNQIIEDYQNEITRTYQ